MNILYFTATNSVGAGNRVLLSWIDYFLQKGYNVAAACPKGGLLSKELRARLGSLYLNSNFYKLDKLNFFKELINILIFCWKFKPDVIHCNAEISYLIARYVKVLLRIPIVVHIRFHFSSGFYAWIFKKKFLPNKIIFVSKSLLEEERHKMPSYIKDNTLTYLHNCLYDPMPDCDFNKNFSRNRGYQFGCFGPIQKRKNQIQLIELAKRFKENDIDAQIVLAGFVREKQYYNTLNNKILCEKLSDKINYVGHIDNIFPFIQKMYATISVSRYETFGMSVLESMAMGVPVISFYVPAISEVLQHTGIIVPFGDTRALYNSCVSLIKDKSLRDKYAQLTRKRFLENFTPAQLCLQLERIYREIL